MTCINTSQRLSSRAYQLSFLIYLYFTRFDSSRVLCYEIIGGLLTIEVLNIYMSLRVSENFKWHSLCIWRGIGGFMFWLSPYHYILALTCDYVNITTLRLVVVIINRIVSMVLANYFISHKWPDTILKLLLYLYYAFILDGLYRKQHVFSFSFCCDYVWSQFRLLWTWSYWLQVWVFWH